LGLQVRRLAWVVLAGLAVAPAWPRGVPERAEPCEHLPDAAMHAARTGDAAAQAAIGTVLVEGLCGASPEAERRGIGWLERASGQGHVAAAARLAVLFERGEITPRDPERALQHYRRAAEGRHVAAQQRLGVLLLSGGDAADRDQGLYWLGSAAGLGDGVAAVMLGIMHSRGLHGIRPDPCLALDWYEASELLGAPIPMEQLRSEIRPSAQRQC